MYRGDISFVKTRPRQKKVSLILCATLIINTLFGSIAMAAMVTASHHSGDVFGDVSLHKQPASPDLPHKKLPHEKLLHQKPHHKKLHQSKQQHHEQHQPEHYHSKVHHNRWHKSGLPENDVSTDGPVHTDHRNTSHDCCEESITDDCTNMAACAVHCAQPLPTLWQQPQSIFCLSYRLDVIATGNLASIDPSRQFKPPRN